MSKTIKATFRGGVFVPQEPYELAEGTEVELFIGDPYTLPPGEPDPEKRKRIMKELIERMKQNPIPADAPRFTRDEMHERR